MCGWWGRRDGGRPTGPSRPTRPTDRRYTPDSMTTTARRCAGCAGPLPESEPDVRQIKCEFCGVVNELAPVAGHAPMTIQITTGRPRTLDKGARALGIAFVLVAIVLTTGLGMGGAYLANRTVSQVTGSFGSFGTSIREVTRTVTAVAPADLGASTSMGWKTLSVGEPPSGWGAFDPIANLAWATAIAQAWQPDARLTRIDLKRLPDTGVFDLSGAGETEAGYRFTSNAQIQRWLATAAAGESSPKVAYELMLTVTQRGVKALATASRPSDSDRPPTAAVNSLTLAPLLERAKRGRSFVPASFYDGYMIFNEREGWVWYLTGRGQMQTLPRVRAKDGAVYPYR